MTVSIIIPCYNSEKFVSEAIESALMQGDCVSEIIVINDGSADGSAGVVKKYPGVRLINQANMGVSRARNNGAEAASGAFLLFLDADDRLKEGAVKAHLEAFNANPNRVFVFGVCDIVDEQGIFIKSYRQKPGVCTYWDILLGITPNPSQCMLSTEAFRQIHGFKSELAYGEDWECFMRMSRTGECYCHGMVVADYRKHGTQATRRPSKILSNMIGIISAHRQEYGAGKLDEEKYLQAQMHYVRLFGKWIPGEAIRHLQGNRFSAALNSGWVFVRHLPYSADGLYSFVRSRIKSKEKQ